MFYKGIVEDNNDPLKLGRVRVRVAEKHPANRTNSNDRVEYVPVELLPWCMPIFPVAISGEGTFYVPKQGSIVAVGYFDSDCQSPFYIGTLPHIAAERPDFSNGFTDPSGTYPTEEYIGRASTNKLATGENTHENIPATNDLFSEPEEAYAAVYPFNTIFSNGAGTVEVDETPEHERIRVTHTSGSFVEMRPDGDVVFKSKGDKYIIAETGDVNVHSGTDVNVYSSSNTNVRAGGNVVVESGGSLTINAEAGSSININGQLVVVGQGGIVLDGGSGSTAGVVTGQCFCPFIGAPHVESSGDVSASKG